jgi:hypothetical protein
MKITFFTRLALSLSLALSLTSCIDDDNLPTPNPTPNDAAQGMIVNASPNSGDLYFFVDNNPINNVALTYTNNSPYLNYKAGTRVFTVKNATGNVLATKSVTPEVNNYFSVFAVNAFSNLELIAYKDVLVYPAPNNARVRFINLSPDAAPIDIKSTTKTYATSLSFKSTTEYAEIPAGTYIFNFVNHDTQKTIYTNPGIQFTNGGVYTVYTKGYVTPPTGSNETFASQTIINYRS